MENSMIIAEMQEKITLTLVDITKLFDDTEITSEYDLKNAQLNLTALIRGLKDITEELKELLISHY